MRRDACAFSRFARTAANFAADFERPPLLASDTAAAIRVSIERAFIFEFRFIMLICAGLSLASAAVA